METRLPKDSAPAVPPRSRAAALSIGLLAATAAGVGAGALFPGSFPLLPLLAGVVAGGVTSLAARTYYSGNPAVAYALSLVLLQAWRDGTGRTDPAGEPLEFLSQALLLDFVTAIGLVMCITACWAVDVRVNFPRAYPDPADRPRGKSVDREVFLFRIAPGVAVLAVGEVLAAAVLPHGIGSALILATAAWVSFRLLRLPGSLWAGFGPLGGLVLYEGYLLQVHLAREAPLPWLPPELWLPAASLTQVLLLRLLVPGRSVPRHDVLPS